ncbi:MAG: glutamate synthase subunit alpha, partial [Treponema sp.]|nr:glutamate synthase subunit alpha [Treponema sp.]
MGEHEEGADQCTLEKHTFGGLYRKEDEHDSCGIGFVADIRGRKSHGILKRGLEVLERMEHRGAESADNKTGDGSGVLIQIPHDYYKKIVSTLPPPGAYGTGLVFLPGPGEDRKSEELRSLTVKIIEETAAVSGLSVLAWRDVPTNSGALGAIAKAAEPLVRQIFLVPRDAGEPASPRAGSGDAGSAGIPDLEFQLYIFRKRLEKVLREQEALKKASVECHLPSLSTRTIVYKGMLMSTQLKDYYPELRDGGIETAVALVHSRFSTNTFPAWSLAQPFRMVSHNGEINTIRGNRFWMAAREALFSHPRMGALLQDILPVLEPDRSDSATFDNMLELLVMSGRSLPHALMMLIPESWNDKNPIPPDLKAFYEYHACIMEPWDGPASMVFCDGRYVGGTLDRNGLRPSRYTITRDDLIVMASETGVQDFAADEVAYKGRLMPGKLLLVDLAEGRIIPDTEVKQEVCRNKPYAEWAKQIITLNQEPEEGALGDPQLNSEEAVSFMERAFGYTREDRERLLLPMAETGQEPTSSMGTDTPIAVFSDKSQRVYAYFKQVFAQVTNPPIDSIREDLVMTLTSFVGPQRNLLDESGAHCRRIKILQPILAPEDLENLKALNPEEFKSLSLDATFYVPLLERAEGGDKAPQGPSPLEAALDRLVQEALKAAEEGVSLLILSDRAALDPEAGRCAVPAHLAVGAVHHGLIKAGRRMELSIIAESAEPRELMHFALLFGYGADLVVPYGALAVIASIYR